MPDGLDARSFYAVVGSIAAMDMGALERVRAILQVVHELFTPIGGHSITGYEFNRTTHTLDLIAMPGAPDREYMRGPTENKLVFAWDAPIDGEVPAIWLENDAEYNGYLDRLQEENRGKPYYRTPPDRSYRARAKVHLATAKVVLYRGLGQTNQEVGQLFFSFRVREDGVRRFTPSMKAAIKFVSCLVREILVARLFPLDRSGEPYTTEHVFRELSRVFEPRHTGSMPRDYIRDLEYAVAQVFRDAALKVTDNSAGIAEFLLLLGGRVAKVFSGSGEHTNPRAVIIPESSITYRCLRDEITYNNGDIAPALASNEIALASCRSLLIVPVALEHEVRAIIRVGSRRQGAFLDSHCRGMASLERNARSAMVFLDERRQRAQMARALDFYMPDSPEDRLAGGGDPALKMSTMLQALDADWGTYWSVNTAANGGFGDRFNPLRSGKNQEPVRTDDPEVGIRVAQNGGVGFTSLLLKLNEFFVEGTFFALHIVPSKERRGGTSHSGEDYFLQVFFPNGGEGSKRADAIDLRDGFSLKSATNARPFDGCDAIELNNNTPREQPHTRVAFVVRDAKGDPLGVMWLTFRSIHDIAWWERRYISGLAGSLGRIFETMNLSLAVDSFRHKVPSQSKEATDGLVTLIDKIRTEQPPHADDWIQRLDELNTLLLTIHWQTCEVRTLLASTQDHAASEFPCRPLAEFVSRAIDLVTGFSTEPDAWHVVYEPKTLTDACVDGVFYPTLYNLLSNVRIHGWERLNGEEELCVIWLRRQGDAIVVVVADNGLPPEQDPILHWSASSSRGHVGKRKDKRMPQGLRLIHALLGRCGGGISFYDRGGLMKKHGAGADCCPEDLRRCNTFFEFFVPYREEESEARDSVVF